MKLRALQRQIESALRDRDIPAADQEARMILKHRLNISWTDLIAHPDRQVPAADIQAIEDDTNKRLSGLPLARIYGVKNFYGLDFRLSESTLEPRGDTETLVDLALESFSNPPRMILDLGTGTGCILLTLLYHWPQAEGIGVDLSEEAARTARANAAWHGLQARARFVCGSWADSLNTKFDLIVSNPPYIESGVIPGLEKEVRIHDPILALDGGADGLEAYKNIFSVLPRLLSPDGIALLEIGYDQARKVAQIGEAAGLTANGPYPDRAGRARVISLSRAPSMGIT